MNSKLIGPSWIPLSRIEQLIQIEPVIVLFIFLIASVFLFVFFLRNTSESRKLSLRRHFLNLTLHFIFFLILFFVYASLQRELDTGDGNPRWTGYLGLATLISGGVVFLKVSRLLILEYLFIGHQREGVPILIVNLFTLVMSIIMVTWLATDLFGVKLTPLLATSAVFSLVLGLALQDTLGNLFAGVALQFDKPYEIGHWIEVTSGSNKFIGQVHEISWRATMLIGVFDEDLVIPNRIIAQAEIANFSRSQKPIWRSQTYKIPYQYSIDHVRQVLLDALGGVAGVLSDPEPIVLVPESNEHWMVVRCSYCISDYGMQWRLGSDINEAIISALHKSGMEIASQKIQIIKESKS